MLTEKSPTLKERFFAKFRRNDETGCWEWAGVKTPAGYGSLFYGGQRKKEMAHRVSYAIHKGPIPEGYEIDHLCRVRHCVNPEHLEAVPHRINWERGQSPAAIVYGSNVCKRGHEYSAENTRILPDFRRICIACARIRMTAFYANNPHYQRDYARKRKAQNISGSPEGFGIDFS